MEHFSKYKLVADDDSDSEGEGDDVKGGDTKKKKAIGASEKVGEMGMDCHAVGVWSY